MIRPAPGFVLAVLAVYQTPSLRADDEPKNSLFDELRDKGVAVPTEMNVPLPAPLMTDNLDASAQKEVLKTLVGRRFSVDEFLARGGTAPHVYQVGKVPVDAAALRVFAVDVSFIAHGRLSTVADRNFPEDLHRQQRYRKIHILNPEELEKRGLRVKSDRQSDESPPLGSILALPKMPSSPTSGARFKLTTKAGGNLVLLSHTRAPTESYPLASPGGRRW